MVILFSGESDMDALEFRGFVNIKSGACLPLKTVEDGDVDRRGDYYSAIKKGMKWYHLQQHQGN